MICHVGNACRRLFAPPCPHPACGPRVQQRADMRGSESGCPRVARGSAACVRGATVLLQERGGAARRAGCSAQWRVRQSLVRQRGWWRGILLRQWRMRQAEGVGQAS